MKVGNRMKENRIKSEMFYLPILFQNSQSFYYYYLFVYEERLCYLKKRSEIKEKELELKKNVKTKGSRNKK
jgi:hypothetical protein